MVGVLVFMIAVLLWIFRFFMKHRWARSLESSMGEWFYDAEHDMTFWKWDLDIEEALIELDREFPLVKVLK